MRGATVRTITLTIIMASAAGCAGSGPSVRPNTADMLTTYQEMAADLSREPTFVTYEQYLSQELIDQIRTDFSNNLDQQVTFLAPPFWFDFVVDTYQGTAGDRQCLVVNGMSEGGDLVSAALEYIGRNETLKIRAVEIALYEPGESLPVDVWCPVRADEF